MSSTAYAKRTQYKPIDFFFRGVTDVKTNKVQFVDAFQILNDRYLGRMSVCNYFFIAENSVRINELNIIALDELKNYDLVMRENFYIPHVTYSLPVTTRFLDNDKDIEVFISALKEFKYKKTDLVVTLYSSTLLKLDEDGKKRYERLRRAGYKICVTGFGEEFNSLDLFAEFNFDYLRCEAAYFDAEPNKKKVLAMLVKFCASNKIGLILEGVDSPSQKARFKREGVKLLTGKAVSKLGRWVTNDFLGLPALTDEKKAAYIKALQKDLKAAEAAAYAELDALRAAAAAKTGEGSVMQNAPRPELIKSPYQVRLEQQKQTAKRIAAQREDNQAHADTPEKEVGDKRRERILMNEMSPMSFEGGVQNALAVSFAQEDRVRLNLEKQTSGEEIFDGEGEKIKQKKLKRDSAKESEKESATVQNVPAEGGKESEKETLTVSSEELQYEGIIAPQAPNAPVAAKKHKKIKPDLEKEKKLYNEFVSDGLNSLSGGFGNGAMSGFGVTLHITAEDTQEGLTGHYNQNGQWVDEDGDVYNGYFDAAGKWVEYEIFDGNREGHYNDDAQWVDAEGNVYDGYFDESGRWIDYSYQTAGGESVDNGYFDDKLGKWVAYGYFDKDGEYHKF